jgi:hypothetical protein
MQSDKSVDWRRVRGAHVSIGIGNFDEEAIALQGGWDEGIDSQLTIVASSISYCEDMG